MTPASRRRDAFHASSRAVDAAVDAVIAGIEKPGIEARYPDRAHFIPADNPRHGEMTTRALFSGDPVVLVYPDGREILFTPEKAGAVAGLALLLILVVSAFRHRKSEATVIRFPPRTRIEARDAGGVPIAA